MSRTIDLEQTIADILEKNKDIKCASLPKNINILLSGGGLGSFYQVGIMKLLDGYCLQNNVNINKIYCVSGGAMVAAFYMNGINVNMFSDIYNEIKNDPEKNSQYLVDVLKQYLTIHLDDDCHLKCSGRLNIFVYEILSRRRIQRKVINKFTSKDDLINVIVGSCTISYVTSRNSYHTHNGCYYIDGIDIDMGLITHDLEQEAEVEIEAEIEIEKPKDTVSDLIIDITYIDYKIKYKLSFIDDCIDNLILKGINDMSKYLYENNIDNKGIRMLHPQESYRGQTLFSKVCEWICEYLWNK